MFSSDQGFVRLQWTKKEAADRIDCLEMRSCVELKLCFSREKRSQAHAVKR